MEKSYAKVIVHGSPITKSNFKLFNKQGRAILPTSSGKYHDRYAVYEEEIALQTRSQNPNIVLDEALIAILKVYYKSEKRHPDTNNVTKSIFDGIEKSGLIVNDAQITRIIIEEFYDKENPRFELELFGESNFKINYMIIEREESLPKKSYCPPPNSKKVTKTTKPLSLNKNNSNFIFCDICGCKIKNNDFITADKGKTKICKGCLTRMI